MFEPLTTKIDITRDCGADSVRLTVWLGPTVGFTTYQICDRYCAGHPYVSDAGIGVDSWTGSALCAGKDY